MAEVEAQPLGPEILFQVRTIDKFLNNDGRRNIVEAGPVELDDVWVVNQVVHDGDLHHMAQVVL